MPGAARGFTLLEVLIATTVLSVGVLALAGTLATAATLGGAGRQLSRAAELLSSRADLIRAALSADSTCTPPPSGSAVQPGGQVERWSVARRGALVEVIGEVAYVRQGLPARDTLVSWIACS